MLSLWLFIVDEISLLALHCLWKSGHLYLTCLHHCDLFTFRVLLCLFPYSFLSFLSNSGFLSSVSIPAVSAPPQAVPTQVTVNTPCVFPSHCNYWCFGCWEVCVLRFCLKMMLLLKVLRIWKNEDINLDKAFKATVSLIHVFCVFWILVEGRNALIFTVLAILHFSLTCASYCSGVLVLQGNHLHWLYHRNISFEVIAMPRPAFLRTL